MSPRWGSTPRRTSWLTVNRNVTLTLTLIQIQESRDQHGAKKTSKDSSTTKGSTESQTQKIVHCRVLIEQSTSQVSWEPRLRRKRKKRAAKDYQHRVYNWEIRRLAFVGHQTRKCVLYLLCVISVRVRINSRVKSEESTSYSCRITPLYVTIYIRFLEININKHGKIKIYPFIFVGFQYYKVGPASD
jgi:hypothetical protein